MSASYDERERLDTEHAQHLDRHDNLPDLHVGDRVFQHGFHDGLSGTVNSILLDAFGVRSYVVVWDTNSNERPMGDVFRITGIVRMGYDPQWSTRPMPSLYRDPIG